MADDYKALGLVLLRAGLVPEGAGRRAGRGLVG